MQRQELATVFKKNWLSSSLLAVFVLASGYLGVRELGRWWAIDREYQNVQKEISLLDARSGELKKELDNLSRPDLMEKEARTRLNLKREGESVLIVVSEDNFPKEDFGASAAKGFWAGLGVRLKAGLDNPDSIWFNIKNWYSYIFPKQ
ncbi:MAG: septum formation initiator family protein [Minisyncoccia bacterium]